MLLARLPLRVAHLPRFPLNGCFHPKYPSTSTGGALSCQSGLDASDSVSKMFFVKDILAGNKCFCTCIGEGGGFIFILVYIGILPAQDFVRGAGVS